MRDQMYLVFERHACAHGGHVLVAPQQRGEGTEGPAHVHLLRLRVRIRVRVGARARVRARVRVGARVRVRVRGQGVGAAPDEAARGARCLSDELGEGAREVGGEDEQRSRC